MLFGLPLHPLIIHLVVVLLPLSALAMLLVMSVRRWRLAYGPLAVAGAIGAAAAALVAMEAGEDLERFTGVSSLHATWGTVTAWSTVGFAALALVWYLVEMPWRRRPQSPVAATIIGWLATAVAVFATVSAVIAGHSGAESVWGATAVDKPTATQSHPGQDRADQREADDDRDSDQSQARERDDDKEKVAADAQADTRTPSDKNADNNAARSTGSASQSYTLAQVREHADAASCWAAVNGKVYDLTDWIGQHPGGKRAIEGLCGQDATAAFDAEHGGQRRPEQALTRYQIGTLQQ